MIEEVKNGKRFVLFPRPQIVDSDKMIHVFGSCIACGELLESAHVVETFMLECRHQYHPLCFSALLQNQKFCVKPSWLHDDSRGGKGLGQWNICCEE